MTTKIKAPRRRSAHTHAGELRLNCARDDGDTTCYLGLDLSLTCSGVVSIDKDGHIIKEVEIKGGKLRGAERLHHLKDCMTTQIHLLDRLGYTDIIAVIENYAMGIRGGKLASIGEWGGICRLLLYDRNIEYVEVSPTSLKKFVTGKGGSPKDVMMLETYKRWGKSFSSNDICDAYGLAQMGRHAREGNLTMTVPQKDAVDKTFNAG